MIIATVNYKGGVGKSTIIDMLAKYLNKLKLRVLLIDSDGQNSTTFHFVQDEEQLEGKSLHKVFANNDIRGNIVKTSEGIDLIPSSFLLNDFRYLPKNRLSQLFQKSNIRDDYDFILIDTPPNLDVFSYGAVLAADKVILPYTLGSFDIKTTSYSFKNLVETLEKPHDAFITIANLVDGVITGKPENLNTQYVDLAKYFLGEEVLGVNLHNDFYIPKSKPLKKAMEREEILSEAKSKAVVYNALCEFFEFVTGVKRPVNF